MSAPLFSTVEREYNRRIAEALCEYGYDLFLPQEAVDRVRTQDPAAFGGDATSQREVIARLSFDACLDGIASSDLVIALLDGADVDSGTAWEVGYAYARGIPVVGVRSDKRSMQRGPVNIMIKNALSASAFYDQPPADLEKLISDVVEVVKEALSDQQARAAVERPA